MRLLLLGIALAFVPLVLMAQAPQWWATRGVQNGNPANDYAAINQGQLKYIATAAVAELDDKLPDGAGTNLHTLIDKWSTLQEDGSRVATSGSNTNDYAAVNLGQLKTVARPFCDRLLAMGYNGHPLKSGTYPWLSGTANDYAMANIGQVKNLFAFDLTVTDTNGLPGWWQHYYFNGSVLDATALAPCGVLISGAPITILQAYQNGISPIDFYNGIPPTLTIVSGGDQRAAPGTAPLSIPLSVRINGGVENAPITFTVTSGSALISATNDGTHAPSTSVSLRSITTYADASGNQQKVAQVYIYLPDNVADLGVITATATSGTQTISISTTAATTDPSLTAPTNFTATPTSPTTADLAWTLSDNTQPTTIQASSDGGASWLTVGAVSGGESSATITNMAPDVSVSFRVITGNCSCAAPSNGTSLSMPSQSNACSTSGGGAAPSSPTQATPRSHPIMLVTYGYDDPGATPPYFQYGSFYEACTFTATYIQYGSGGTDTTHDNVFYSYKFQGNKGDLVMWYETLWVQKEGDEDPTVIDVSVKSQILAGSESQTFNVDLSTSSYVGDGIFIMDFAYLLPVQFKYIRLNYNDPCSDRMDDDVFYIPDDPDVREDGTYETRCDFEVSIKDGISISGALSTGNDGDYFIDSEGNMVTNIDIGETPIRLTVVTRSDKVDDFSIYFDPVINE